MTTYKEFSTIKTKIEKIDDKGRIVPAGTEGTIIDVISYEFAAYTIEVMILDESKRYQIDANIFDALHEEIELVAPFRVVNA